MTPKFGLAMVIGMVCAFAHVSRSIASCVLLPTPHVDSVFAYTSTLIKALAVLKVSTAILDTAKDLANPSDSIAALQTAINGFDCINSYIDPYATPHVLSTKGSEITLSAGSFKAVTLTIKPAAEADLLEYKNRMDGKSESASNLKANERDGQIRRELAWRMLKNATLAACLSTWNFDAAQQRAVSLLTKAERASLLTGIFQSFGDLSSDNGGTPSFLDAVTVLRDCLADETKYPSRPAP